MMALELLCRGASIFCSPVQLHAMIRRCKKVKCCLLAQNGVKNCFGTAQAFQHLQEEFGNTLRDGTDNMLLLLFGMEVILLPVVPEGTVNFHIVQAFWSLP